MGQNAEISVKSGNTQAFVTIVKPYFGGGNAQAEDFNNPVLVMQHGSSNKHTIINVPVNPSHLANGDNHPNPLIIEEGRVITINNLINGDSYFFTYHQLGEGNLSGNAFNAMAIGEKAAKPHLPPNTPSFSRSTDENKQGTSNEDQQGNTFFNGLTFNIDLKDKLFPVDVVIIRYALEQNESNSFTPNQLATLSIKLDSTVQADLDIIHKMRTDKEWRFPTDNILLEGEQYNFSVQVFKNDLNSLQSEILVVDMNPLPVDIINFEAIVIDKHISYQVIVDKTAAEKGDYYNVYWENLNELDEDALNPDELGSFRHFDRKLREADFDVNGNNDLVFNGSISASLGSIIRVIVVPVSNKDVKGTERVSDVLLLEGLKNSMLQISVKSHTMKDGKGNVTLLFKSSHAASEFGFVKRYLDLSTLVNVSSTYDAVIDAIIDSLNQQGFQETGLPINGMPNLNGASLLEKINSILRVTGYDFDAPVPVSIFDHIENLALGFGNLVSALLPTKVFSIGKRKQTADEILNGDNSWMLTEKLELDDTGSAEITIYMTNMGGAENEIVLGVGDIIGHEDNIFMLLGGVIGVNSDHAVLVGQGQGPDGVDAIEKEVKISPIVTSPVNSFPVSAQAPLTPVLNAIVTTSNSIHLSWQTTFADNIEFRLKSAETYIVALALNAGLDADYKEAKKSIIQEQEITNGDEFAVFSGLARLNETNKLNKYTVFLYSKKEELSSGIVKATTSLSSAELIPPFNYLEDFTLVAGKTLENDGDGGIKNMVNVTGTVIINKHLFDGVFDKLEMKSYDEHGIEHADAVQQFTNLTKVPGTANTYKWTHSMEANKIYYLSLEAHTKARAENQAAGLPAIAPAKSAKVYKTLDLALSPLIVSIGYSQNLILKNTLYQVEVNPRGGEMQNMDILVIPNTGTDATSMSAPANTHSNDATVFFAMQKINVKPNGNIIYKQSIPYLNQVNFQDGNGLELVIASTRVGTAYGGTLFHGDDVVMSMPLAF